MGGTVSNPLHHHSKLYPSLPLRRHSYSNSPDSAIVSTRPSFSSTLPCPNSRLKSMIYLQATEPKSLQFACKRDYFHCYHCLLLLMMVSYFRSRSSPYEVSDHKSDQVSTPIELRDITQDNITDINDIVPIDTEEENIINDINSDNMEHELDNNYDEDNFSFVNHSLSQQPLLNMSTFQNSMV